MSNQANVIRILERVGFIPDGATKSEEVMVPTVESPRFGGCGGELRTFGGRLRYRKGQAFVTVGNRTTCFYIKAPGCEPTSFINIPSKDLLAIEGKAVAITEESTNDH